MYVLAMLAIDSKPPVRRRRGPSTSSSSVVRSVVVGVLCPVLRPSVVRPVVTSSSVRPPRPSVVVRRPSVQGASGARARVLLGHTALFE